MFRILPILALLLIGAPAALRAQHVVRYCDTANTQIDYNFCAASESGLAHDAMQAVYEQVLGTLDPPQARLLEQAQRAWDDQTEAECEVEAAPFEDGSIQPSVRAWCHMEASEKRTARLRLFLGESRWAGGGAGEHEVVAAAESLFVAMLARDTTALRRLLHPRAIIVSVAEGGQGARVRTVDEWIPGVARNPEALKERIWDPEVQIDGDMATLRAPYDFHLGRRLSHCGVDAFQFVREGGVWKLIAVTFTVRTEGCEPPVRWDPGTAP
ncbi:MAG TPA: lysozyme inhibitor LprI family protein [Longimicrobium sp.]|nr:lysozyme inhibitor LprI family protein [Longimicrobium sp.]